MMQRDLFVDSGAEISDCRRYRYSLWRLWTNQGFSNCVAFIGLNPSTADEIDNDMTITKCIGFAERWGFGGVYMLNLYCFRATQPLDLVQSDDPIGKYADQIFSGYRFHKTPLVVAAWGSLTTRWRVRLQWQSRITRVLRQIDRPVLCLGKTSDGSPRHPSRIAYATEREPFWSPEPKS